MKQVWIYFLIQSFVFLKFTEQKSLDSYIRHYEEIDYSTHDLHQSHLRSKRSVGDKTLRFQFHAFDRDFKLVLNPDNQIFDKYAVLENHGLVDTSHIYRGTLADDKNSRVFGYVIEGQFKGTVRVPGDTTYHIEPVRRFVNRVPALPKSHSIIYKEEHLNLDPHRLRREAETALGACGNDKNHDWMLKVSENGFRTRARRSFYEEEETPHFHNKYAEAANQWGRSKRETLVNRNTCFLYMQADPTLFDKVKITYGNNEERTKEDIIGTFASHVDAINNIYSNTVFKTYDNSMRYSGIRFKIQRTSIMTRATEKCDNALQATKFCSDNIDVSNFLNLNSLRNHSEFCLAYIFTYRDFTQGTLGLAWVGSSGQASGGICEKFKEFPEGGQRVYKSLNTGIVTLVNYGDDVAPRVSQLTFAHEVGHNFGSPHDSGPLCAPQGTSAPDASQGNYIMYASATKGNQPHNDEFSACSLDNMTRVMDAVFNQRYGKSNCFKDSNEAFCGNSIVEAGEECDCGYHEDCTDICCVGRQSDGTGCKLKAGKYCSPSQGGCCDPGTCQYYTDNRRCREPTECARESNCTGTAICPPSQPFPDYQTFCNSKTKVCVNGRCIGSLCYKIGYTDCSVKAEGDSVAVKEKQCLLGCKVNDSNVETNECFYEGNDNNPTAFKNLITQVQTPGKSVSLGPGDSCNDDQGRCDVFRRCRGVNAEGPLSRLKNLLFREETLTDIREWITAHWWAVILISIGLIVFMGLFIKICAVHTPSSNPKAPPAQHWGDTLRRRRSHPRHRNQQQSAGEPLRQSAPMGPPPPYSASSSSSSKPHPKHGKGQRGKGQGKKARGGKDVRV